MRNSMTATTGTRSARACLDREGSIMSLSELDCSARYAMHVYAKSCPARGAFCICQRLCREQSCIASDYKRSFDLTLEASAATGKGMQYETFSRRRLDRP